MCHRMYPLFWLCNLRNYLSCVYLNMCHSIFCSTFCFLFFVLPCSSFYRLINMVNLSYQHLTTSTTLAALTYRDHCHVYIVKSRILVHYTFRAGATNTHRIDEVSFLLRNTQVVALFLSFLPSFRLPPMRHKHSDTKKEVLDFMKGCLAFFNPGK